VIQKQDELKENHTWTQHNQMAENKKRKLSKAAGEK